MMQIALFAVSSSSSATMRGRIAVRAGRKKIEIEVSRKTSGKTSARFVTAAIGMKSTIAARSRSLTIITSFWSQRSTNVPAIGPRSRFGMAAAMNTRPTASGELVATSTRNASAIWCMRSPKRLISWPVQSAENEPLSASRT